MTSWNGPLTVENIFHQFYVLETFRDTIKAKNPSDKFNVELQVPKEGKGVFWSLAYKSLNALEKLQIKLKNWCISPSVCYLCLRNAESLDHFLLHCPYAS